MRVVRITVAVGSLLALIGLAWVWWGGPARSDRDRMGAAKWMSNDRCRECHGEVWREWSGSRHAATWNSPQVQAAFQHFGHDRKCQSCHAPVPVFQTGLDQEVAFRSDDRASGVNCLSCHAREDGSVAANRDIPLAPCRPRRTPELASSRSCGVCHDAIYKDWQATDWAARGKTCQSCHMRLAADPARPSHACVGGYDIGLVRGAVRLEVRRVENELEAAITNHGAGHNLPGERHNRVLILDVLETTGDGQIALASQSIIKGVTPFRGESSSERLQFGQTHHVRFPVESTASRGRVRLLYKRFPWLADRDAEILHEAQIEFATPKPHH